MSHGGPAEFLAAILQLATGGGDWLGGVATMTLKGPTLCPCSDLCHLGLQ